MSADLCPRLELESRVKTSELGTSELYYVFQLVLLLQGEVI